MIERTNIVSVNRYLQDVHTKFQSYLREGHRLCDLRDLNYSGGKVPDYTKYHIQLYYLLRYAYAYTFEYKNMYLNLLGNQPVERLVGANGAVNVTSIGCGALLDYWGLARTLEVRGRPGTPVRYRGIDVVDWDERIRIPRRSQDTVTYCLEDALAVLARDVQLDSDIYFFPKSISEFSEQDFTALCSLFATKPIANQRFSIMISIREQAQTKEKDQKRAERLQQAVLSNNGFQAVFSGFYESPENMAGEKIRKVDPDFQHPKAIVDTLTALCDACSSYPDNCVSGASAKLFLELCENDLNRFPILNLKYLRYQLCVFERQP